MAVLPPPRSDLDRPAELRALTYDAGDAAVIVVEGWLDGSSVPALERALIDALEHGHRELVLDLHQLRSVDATATAVLWAGLRAALRRGGTLATAGLRPSLQASVAPLVPHGLRLHETVHDAIAACHGLDART
jgi:anti-anti-sigma factor